MERKAANPRHATPLTTPPLAPLWSLPLAQRVALRRELERVKAAAEQWLVRLG
jgi:hypothetical protein